MTFVSDWWANVDITFYGKKEDYQKIGTESAMLMPNHRSDIDWLVGYMIADRNGILGVWQSADQFHFFNCLQLGLRKHFKIRGASTGVHINRGLSNRPKW